MGKNNGKGKTLKILKAAMRKNYACEWAEDYIESMPFDTLELVWCNWGNGTTAIVSEYDLVAWSNWIMYHLYHDLGSEDPPTDCILMPSSYFQGKYRYHSHQELGDHVRENLPLEKLEDLLLRWEARRRGR